MTTGSVRLAQSAEDFDSATFLTHAKAMYEAAGFVPMPHPKGFPDAWRRRVYFMTRDLG